MQRTFLAGAVALALLLSGMVLAASTYELARSTVSSGGAASTGGSYTLGGTAGQIDAGQLTGSTYTIGGGFWGGGALPTQSEHKRHLPLMVRPDYTGIGISS
jgi:hypothetical protein